MKGSKADSNSLDSTVDSTDSSYSCNNYCKGVDGGLTGLFF